MSCSKVEDPELNWARDWTDEVLEARALHKRAKLKAEIALRGFDSWRKLRGLSFSDIADWSRKPPVVALLRRSLEYANRGYVVLGDKESAEINLTGSVAAIAGGIDRQAEQASAEETVNILQDCAALEEQFWCLAKRMLESLGQELAPRAAMKALHGTAKNYISYLAFACCMCSSDLSSYEDALKMVIRGLAKWRLRHNCTKLELRVLRDDKMIKLLVTPFDDLGWHQLSVQIIVGYKFILRVLNARLTITMGAADQTLQMSYGVATAYGSK